MEIGEASAFNRRIMAGAGERDDAFFARVRVDDESLESRCNDFVFFGEKEDCRHVAGARVGDAVEIARDFLGHGAGEQPEIPPAKLPEDNLPERGRVVEDEAGDLVVCRDVKRGRGSEAGAEDNDRAIACDFLQFVECG